jgi:hypothetical protein
MSSGRELHQIGETSNKCLVLKMNRFFSAKMKSRKKFKKKDYLFFLSND